MPLFFVAFGYDSAERTRNDCCEQLIVADNHAEAFVLWRRCKYTQDMTEHFEHYDDMDVEVYQIPEPLTPPLTWHDKGEVPWVTLPKEEYWFNSDALHLQAIEAELDKVTTDANSRSELL